MRQEGTRVAGRQVAASIIAREMVSGNSDGRHAQWSTEAKDNANSSRHVSMQGHSVQMEQSSLAKMSSL
jgi:hypothetical protein